MKKLALITVAVTVTVTLGLLKLNAKDNNQGIGSSLPKGLTLVDISLVAIDQGGTDTNTNNGKTVAHTAQTKINNNDILSLINTEFGTSFSTSGGDRLVVSNFWDGQFMVLDKTGNVLLANASSNTNGDHFVLDLTSTNTAVSGKISANSGTKVSLTEGMLNYTSGDGNSSFQLIGLTTVKDSYSNGLSNSMESFELSNGVGSISDTNGSGLLTGSVSGKGKDNVPAP